MKAALYARVSTNDGRQTTQNQIIEQAEFCARRSWEVVATFQDEASGSQGGRSALRDLLAAAHRREFDSVVVWALDRFTREGVLKAFEYIEQLKRAGVEFHSVTEPQFSTAGPHGELFIALAAWMAKQERVRLQERVKAGMARAREQGTQLGRRAVVFDIERARHMRAAGVSWRAIALALKTPATTIKRRLGDGKLSTPFS